MSSLIRQTVALFVVLVVVLPRAGVSWAGQNLIVNPGFELGDGKMLTVWSLGEGAQENTFDWVKCDGTGNEVHSGSRALRMNALRAPEPDHSMGVVSNRFPVPAHARVEASIWIKALEVANEGGVDWYGLRVTLTAYTAKGGTLEHRDLLNEEGTFSWKKIQGGMIVPQGAAALDLSVKLTTSTGTVWIDDAEVKVVEEVPAVNLTGLYNPVLIPFPWQANLSYDKFPLGSVAVLDSSGDGRVRDALDSFLTEARVAHAFLAENDPHVTDYGTQLIVGDGANPVLAREFALRFANYSWPDIEEQGYFLAVAKGVSPNHIYIGANGPRGQFYAIQTLRQLVRNKYAYVADILDKPTVSRRGIPMGLQWFDQRTSEALRRLTQLKFNLVWTQGSFLDDYLNTDNWRLDFTASQRAALQEFLDLYQKNFIEVWIAIGPRGKNPPLQYSSDSDIDTVVRKMDVLYTLGLRNHGLRFDDLINVGEDRLLVAQDIETFNNDMGAAQAYFINAVYSRLKALHPDINFLVVPMDYNQTGNFGDRSAAAARLRQFYGLPAAIQVLTVCYYDDDVLATTCLTGRSQVLQESNFYTEGSGELPEYVVPYLDFISWQNAAVRARISSFTWLPKMPQAEDAALVSWYTAADCAWAPERYDPNRSFQRAAARYLGVPDAAVGGNNAQE